MGTQIDEQGPKAETQDSPLPPCCGTGCTVCVLDDPEYFQRSRSSELNLMAMLDAFEQAEASITRQDGDSL